MKLLFAFQIALGILKVCMAFSQTGSKRRTWHLGSGLVMMALGIILMVQVR